MHFLVQCPESAAVGDFPFFGSTVSETALAAARALNPQTLLIVAEDEPEAGWEATAARLRALPEEAPGVVLPAGLLEPPGAELQRLAQAESGSPP